MKNIIDILRERCLLDDVTSPDVDKRTESPITVYAGFDPSAESLQVGNLVTVKVLAHFIECGHKVVALVGGATGMIGDPSGKSSERALLDEATVEINQKGIEENLVRILGRSGPSDSVKIVNNREWLDKFTFIEFLRDVGKNFRMGTMLGKESVRARLDSDTGMSFTEFSYQLLQAYDFLRLFEDQNCIMQIGGSDQWGNITAGIDLVRRLKSEEVYGVTMPLVCDSSGQKFGKSEGNAIYLDSAKTSFYDFYQFFLRTDDADAVRFLKIFTFMSIEEIAEFEKKFQDDPGRRETQKRLAEEVTRLVHGDEGLEKAQKATAVMYGEAMDGLNAADLLAVFSDVDSVEMAKDDIEGKLVIDVVAASGMLKSKGEVRRLISSGGLYLNNNRVESVEAMVESSNIIDGQILVLRSGKKNYHLVRVV
jgi:tyrosyl-tRNA synthetase